MKILRLFAILLALLICIGTALPFIRTDQWWVRMFDFPRVQIIVLGLFALIFLLTRVRRSGLFDRVLAALLFVAMVTQAVQIFPYTPLAAEQVKRADSEHRSVRIFIANVLQDNHRTEDLIALIRQKDPDMILLSETDQWWAEQMAWLKESHPNFVEQPQDNTYGMLLYSRLPLIGSEVMFLVDPKVPSIKTDVELTDGTMIRFHGVHPRPPANKDPDRDEVQDSDQRDAELVVLANMVEDLGQPVVVAGDFNDVAWSHTTRLFQRTGRLLDPRVGRGFFNTYHARNPLFRYPLDHLFHSEHFTLISIERLEDVGSDHFPMYVHLQLEPGAAAEQEPPAPKKNDSEEEQEMMEREEEERQEQEVGK